MFNLSRTSSSSDTSLGSDDSLKPSPESSSVEQSVAVSSPRTHSPPDDTLAFSEARFPQGYTCFNGLNFPPLVQPANLESLANFGTRSDDIYLCTYPKSGTTWMQQILRLLANGGYPNPHTTIADDVPYLEEFHADVLTARKSPRILKTHLPYEMTPKPSRMGTKDAPKYILVTRNPRDIAVSFYYHARAFRNYKFTGDWDTYYQIFMSGRVDYGSWFDHTYSWWQHRHLSNILVLSYEELQEDIGCVLRKLVDFLGWSGISEEGLQNTARMSSFSHMVKDNTANYAWSESARRPGHTPFLRKGKVGDWTNHFTADQIQQFDKVYQSYLERCVDFPRMYSS